jgi:hypothetical protein
MMQDVEQPSKLQRSSQKRKFQQPVRSVVSEMGAVPIRIAIVRCRFLAAGILLLTGVLFAADCGSAEMSYPQVLRARYEATNPKVGGNFIIWLDREKMWHGLDPRLYPPVRYVEVTHITPSPGSPIITIIELMPVNSTTPEFYHLAGIVRFRVTGLTLKSSNIPHADSPH